MPRHFRGSLSALFVVAAVGCESSTAAPPVAEAHQRLASDTGYSNVAWEQVSSPPPAGDDLASLSDNLWLLAEHGLSLTLHWPADQLEDPERWTLVENALARGVPVYPWITLPDGDGDPNSPNYDSTGYFPNATNYEAWCGAARAMLWLWQAHGFPATTLIVDFEMRKERLAQFMSLSSSDPGGTIALLKENRDRVGPERFAAAKQGFAEFVDYAHQFGFRVEATMLLALLDDFADGDDALRQGFQVPLDTDVPWDALAFQAQRTLYQSFGPTSYFVYDYARKAQNYFGSRASINVGNTDGGWATTTPTYASGDELRQDVEAALAAGITPQNVSVYSFYGMYKSGQDVEQWFQAPEPHPADWSPAPDLATPTVSASQQALDLAMKL